jgi:hypothetical protein
MRPFSIYPRGNTLFINGGDCIKRYDGSRYFVDACASITHICAISDTMELCIGNISKDGIVSDFWIHGDLGDFCTVAATTNTVYLLSMSLTLLFFDATMNPKDPWINMVPVQSDTHVIFVRIKCGRRFVAAIDSHGDLWVHGQLGGEHYNLLTRIHHDVVDFSCGDFHVILLQEDGTAVSYGESKYLIEPTPMVSRLAALGKKTILVKE